MAPRIRSLVSLAALAAIAACASDSTLPSDGSTPNLRVSQDGSEGADHNHAGRGDRQVHERRDSPGVGRAKPHGGGGGTGISYHGGPVLQAATKVVAVYWANSAIYLNGPIPGSTGGGASDGSLVGFFLRNLGGSAYFNINTTYTNGSGKAIANVVNYVGFWANNTNAPSGTQSVSDASMLAMLQSGFTSGKLSYDANTLYVIFTAGTVNLGGGFGTQYCAYHWYGNLTLNGQSKWVLYSAMPYDYAYANACTANAASPNNDPGADAEVNTLAHEIEETTTDMYLSAWYDSRGYENADKCAWNFGAYYTTPNGGIANIKVGGKDFLVQQNWINAGSGGCRLSW